MMKKGLCIIIIVSFLSTSSLCFAYSAKCINEQGKFSSCKVNVKEGVVDVHYKLKQWQHMDKTIRGDQITELSCGEYARRRVAESVATGIILTPLFLFMLFAKEKKENVGIEYMKDDGNKDAVLLQINKKHSFALKQHLETISGKVFQSEGEGVEEEGASSSKGKPARKDVQKKGIADEDVGGGEIQKKSADKEEPEESRFRRRSNKYAR
jgi:hypothetical protein